MLIHLDIRLTRFCASVLRNSGKRAQVQVQVSVLSAPRLSISDAEVQVSTLSPVSQSLRRLRCRFGRVFVLLELIWDQLLCSISAQHGPLSVLRRRWAFTFLSLRVCKSPGTMGACGFAV